MKLLIKYQGLFLLVSLVLETKGSDESGELFGSPPPMMRAKT